MATEVRRAPDGTLYLRSPYPLGPYATKLTERLELWAERVPDRTFLAERDAGGGWQRLTYGQALGRVRPLAQALLDRGLSQDRPLAILSGNGAEHALLALAAMYAGVLYAPIAPAYSLQARDYGTLGRIFELLQPGLVFAADGAPFARALASVLPPGVELVTSSSTPGGIPATAFAELEGTPVTPRVDEAHARVTPDTIAKILFTSGSTGRPKGVINTQRMLCANQEQHRTVMTFLREEPPILCDWLPWNHTFGGNHDFGLVLYNGGTFYLDEGRPTPGAIETTVRNLRDIATTAYFNVPRGYEMLMPYLQSDAELRRTFFSRVHILFYAAAGLGQRFWDALQQLAVEACGEEILMVTGLGATESAPFAITTGREGAQSGMVGVPGPGVELKVAAVGSKLEARVRGPNITPGYWRQDDLTRAAFDEEGYYRLGDAVRPADPDDVTKGFMYDGRLAEDFKLSTGTWVSVGPLRAKLLAEGDGVVQDSVIAGHDRAFVAALIFPNVAACRALCGGEIAPAAPAREVLGHPAVRRRFQGLLDDLARLSTGTSTRVARAIVLDEPPSIDAREMTDKGSINQKAVLRHRAALVEELYAPHASSRVLEAASSHADRR
ncbi:MAG: feruloyl-CoA synthase [Gemmatimonadetes bacterium]|nr:feruloyl-CoA synthase [Gemmatimonadota bacterium]